MYDITPIVQAVLTLVGVLITSLLIPWVRSKTSEVQQKDLKQWVKIAVAAAEQIYVGQGRGKEKKQYVLEFLQRYNLKIDTDAIDAMIEAAVYELK